MDRHTQYTLRGYAHLTRLVDFMIDGAKHDVAAGGPKSMESTLQHAGSISEVLDLMNEYVRKLDHAELGSLPRECRPREFTNPLELSSYAFELKRLVCDGSGDIPPQARKLMEVAAAASSQMAVIYRRDEMRRRATRS